MTRDRMPSVHVEHTLALTAQGVQIITADEGAFDSEETGNRNHQELANTEQEGARRE